MIFGLFSRVCPLLTKRRSSPVRGLRARRSSGSPETLVPSPTPRDPLRKKEKKKEKKKWKTLSSSDLGTTPGFSVKFSWPHLSRVGDQRRDLAFDRKVGSILEAASEKEAFSEEGEKQKQNERQSHERQRDGSLEKWQ